jgi:hypothetical protein
MYVKTGAQFPFILISPQLKENFSNWPSSYVMEVVDYVKTYLRIDEKRIYLTGLSLGGGGAWWTAQDYPQLFAALAPVCGGRNSISKACGIAAENLPVWAFHGDRDPVVALSKTVNMVNAINNCLPAASPQALVTIYPGVGHDAWNNAYQIDNSVHTPNVYEWMLACKNTINAGNAIPNANAGADKTISGTSISITASGSDPDGSISVFYWSQLAGPSVATLGNRATRTLAASNLQVGDYIFSVRVTDNGGASDTDYVSVKIDNTNVMPVAKAGSDATLYVPENSMAIIGSGTDADGTISGYLWNKVSGPACSLAGVSTTCLSATELLTGTYVFRLTVTDNRGAKSFDDMTLFVKQPVAPVADAGPNVLAVLPANTVSIPGSAADEDGSIVSYQWTQRSGSACSLTGTTLSTVTASGLRSGAYIFRLTVSDNMGLTNYDDVMLNVTEPPIVNAGEDQVINLPLNSVVLTGSASDSDGFIKSYAWSKYSGPSASLQNKNTPLLTAGDLKEGSYVFMLKVSDNFYVRSVDYVTVTVTANTAVNLATKTMASAKTAAQQELQSREEEVSGARETQGRSATLGDKTSADLEDCLVAIFDGRGEQIFSGVWTIEKYNEVFRHNGLYSYNIMKGGRRVDSGKMYIIH